MSRRYWIPVAFTLVIAGWGSNQFTAMMFFYKERYDFTQIDVTSMLGIYVLGLLPALILGGSVSDRIGRKRATLFAVVLAIFSTVALILGPWATTMFYVGRLVSGIAIGITMATATSWVKELSQPPWDESARPGAGAKRASLSIAGGFFLGPIISGLVANFLPLPEVLPYVPHIAISVPIFLALLKVPDTAGRHKVAMSSASAVEPSPSWIYPGARKRFWTVVGFSAPWAFISGTVAWAVIPQTLQNLNDLGLLYSTIAIALTLGFGVLAQPFAAKIDRTDSARASLTGLVVTAIGLALGLMTSLFQLPWLGLFCYAILGCGYGILMSGGLLETQRVATPERLGAVTGIFYILAYAGFLAPTIIAFLELFFIENHVLVGIVVLCLISILLVALTSKKNLPVQQEHLELVHEGDSA